MTRQHYYAVYFHFLPPRDAILLALIISLYPFVITQKPVMTVIIIMGVISNGETK